MGRTAGNAYEYQTDVGVLIFNRVEELFEPILTLLRSGPKPAWELEDDLASRFKVSSPERRALLRNGHRAWENHVAWALSHLRRRRSVTKITIQKAPDAAGAAYTSGTYNRRFG